MAFDLSEILKDVSTPDTGRDVIQYLPYANIIPDAKNGYSMDGLDELARSIELVGLQQPLRVRELADHTVQILSGHRRHAAIGRIIDRNSKAFPDGIPCIIDRGEASAALQELKLILGNADNRKLTPADEAQQLERMSDCIRRLEQEGYKFPGRHRDWLSKMSGMSKSKIGRLEAIRKHLSTTWLNLFTAGKLPESVAYAMQQIPESYQELLYQLCMDAKPRVQPASLIEYTVKNYAESVSHAESMVCTVDGHGGEPCIWKERLIAAGNARPGWSDHYGRCSSYYSCSACCSTCDRLAVCEDVCPRMRVKAVEAAKKKAQKDAKAQAEAERARAASRERFEREHAERIAKESKAWARLGARRRELGLSCADAYGLDIYDEEDIADVEGREEGRITGESWQDCLDVLSSADYCAMADRLQCSVDYLMGRARDPEPAAVPRPDTELDWLTGEPPHEGRYLCLVDMNTAKLHEQRCEWKGGQWLAYGQPIHELFSVKAWWPLPPETYWLPHEAPEDDEEGGEENA